MHNFSNVLFAKSSHSKAAGCVEVGISSNFIAVRDSKSPDNGTLLFNRHEWECFLAGVKDGEFDIA